MKQRPPNLPDYHRPPIDEVAIAVQFSPIDGFVDDNARKYWHKVQQDYPISERQPRLEGPIESLDPTPTQMIQIPVGIPAPVRTWLIADTDDFLIQVQDTRFIQNWRRREAEYEHFEKIHQLFWNNFRKFREYLDSAGLPQPQIQQVEVSYINWIPDTSLIDFLRPASESKITLSGSEQEPEDQSWSARYLIQNQAEMVQRLYAQSGPAVRAQPPHAKGAQFALVFRGARETGIEDSEAEDVIYAARIIIVEAFTELTTDSAQAAWERFK